MREIINNIRTQLSTNPVYQGIAVGIVALLTICGLIFTVQQGEFNPPIQFQQVTYQARSGAQYSLIVEVARTPQEQYQGLRFRQSLDANNGMLFIFDNAAYQTFTMQDTFVSLDMIFLDAEQRVVTIYERTATNQTDIFYPSTAPSKYVVEAAAGWVDRTGIQVGDYIAIK